MPWIAPVVMAVTSAAAAAYSANQQKKSAEEAARSNRKSSLSTDALNQKNYDAYRKEVAQNDFLTRYLAGKESSSPEQIALRQMLAHFLGNQLLRPSGVTDVAGNEARDAYGRTAETLRSNLLGTPGIPAGKLAQGMSNINDTILSGESVYMRSKEQQRMDVINKIMQLISLGTQRYPLVSAQGIPAPYNLTAPPAMPAVPTTSGIVAQSIGSASEKLLDLYSKNPNIFKPSASSGYGAVA